jgi:hypothetical protein
MSHGGNWRKLKATLRPTRTCFSGQRDSVLASSIPRLQDFPIACDCLDCSGCTAVATSQLARSWTK